MNATQLPLFEGVRPYAGAVPHAGTDTSRAAAADLDDKLGEWQQRVLLALLEQPQTDEELEDRLACARTRTSRPRRRELAIAGYVEDSGDRAVGFAGKQQIVWRLTAKGRETANRLTPEGAAVAEEGS